MPITVISTPIHWLKEYDTEIVDTPGIGSIFRDNQEMTHNFIYRSDVILFLSDCNRQFIEETEQLLLRSLKGRDIIFVLNQIDRLNHELEDLKIILEKIMPEITKYVKNPIMIPISARKAKLALKAKEQGDTALFETLWKESRLNDLKQVLFSELSSNNRVKHKLRSSLVNVQIAIQELGERIDRQRSLLLEKRDVLTNLVQTIHHYKQVLLESFEKTELNSLDQLIEQIKSNLIKVFRDFKTFRLIYDSSLIESYLQEAFGNQFLKDTEHKVDYHSKSY
jgi:translation elongation factor EF-G